LPASAAALVNDIRRCMEQARPVVAAYPHETADGRQTHLCYHLSPIPDGHGLGGGVMAMVEDHTDLKRTEAALRESERRYRRLFQSAPIALIEWDVSRLKTRLERVYASGVPDLRRFLEDHPDEVQQCWSLIRTTDYNQAFLDLMGVAGGITRDTVFLPTDAKGFMDMAREVILMAAEGRAVVEREETIVTTSGETKVVLGKSLVMSGHEATLERVAIAMVDISQRKAAEAALRESERRFREQALRDGITGLYNQRHLYAALTEWLDWARRSDDSVGLIFVDLDRFKTVVDTHGHLDGSRVIREVAHTIDGCLTPPAFAVAYAGDEFVVVLPGAQMAQAMETAADIRARIRESVYMLDHEVTVRLTASFGVAAFPQHADDLRSLIAAADSALFTVKETGRDAIGPCSVGPLR
jgi:diguanylate cyclase (GGDEF)-like protein